MIKNTIHLVALNDDKFSTLPVNIYVYMCMCVCVPAHVCMRVCMRVCVRACVRACVCVHIYGLFSNTLKIKNFFFAQNFFMFFSIFLTLPIFSGFFNVKFRPRNYQNSSSYEFLKFL